MKNPKKTGSRAPKLSIEDRKAQLLSCAIRVFARDGIASAGHAEVAKEADVAVATVFSYFRSRVALVEAVLTEVESVIMGRAHTAIVPYETVSDRLQSMLRNFSASVKENPDYAVIWVNWGTSFHGRVWTRYKKFVRTVIQLHEEILETGLKRGEPVASVDPKMSAFLFIGAATVIVQMKMQHQDSRSVQRYLATILHGALHQADE